jgi:hypothetical protein
MSLKEFIISLTHDICQIELADSSQNKPFPFVLGPCIIVTYSGQYQSGLLIMGV